MSNIIDRLLNLEKIMNKNYESIKVDKDYMTRNEESMMDTMGTVYDSEPCEITALEKANNTPLPEIFEYIRERKHGKMVKVGIILGLRDGDTIRVGWSKCNIKEDKMDKDVAFEMAVERCYPNPEDKITPMPDCIRRQVRQFGSRCFRYFKDCRVVILPK